MFGGRIVLWMKTKNMHLPFDNPLLEELQASMTPQEKLQMPTSLTRPRTTKPNAAIAAHTFKSLLTCKDLSKTRNMGKI
jgi:hypothetical protein